MIYLGGGAWRESRDVVFLENIKGAPQVGMGVLGSQQQPVGYSGTTSTPHAVRTPFPLAVPGPNVPYLDCEVSEASNPPNSSPIPSNSPQQAFPGPSEEAARAPEPTPQE
jgi:hypothetical protein